MHVYNCWRICFTSHVILPYTEPVVYRGSMFGDGDGPIVYSNLKCEGFESDLTSCDKDEFPLSVCSRSNVVGVLCKDGKYHKYHIIIAR